jgi:hypothetical protein
MAQTGFTPIQLYFSSTTTNVPLAANLASGELAINITDGKLFYKDNASAVQVIGWKVVPATAGGTGQTSYAVGDLLYADTTTTLAKLPDVATGNALISGGVGVAPSYGKIGLTTHVSGTLPTANGGTNLTSFTANGILYASSTSALATGSALTFDGTNFATTGTGAFSKLTTTNSTDVVIENIISQPNALYYSALTLQNTGASGKSYQLTVGGNTSAVPGGMYVYNATNGNVPITLVDASNNFTVGLGNVVIGTNGKGIDFSATPGTGTSELLADYEEGTWTPVVTPVVGAITSYTSSGTYTKIGRSVTINCIFNITNNGTGSTGVLVAGLPYNMADGVGGAAREGGLTGSICSVSKNAADQIIMYTYANLYPGGTGASFSFSFVYTV